MTRYFYDTEFIEDGRTIELISIGIVADDGREYYAVNGDITRPFRGWGLRRRIRKHAWIMDNVVSSLPRPKGDWILQMPNRWLFDYANRAVKPRFLISYEVKNFLLEGHDMSMPDIELWADYAAYDHVALAQLWGPMVKLPHGIPMFTNDIQQELAKLTPGENNKPPEQTGTAHNALDDARHVKAQWEWLATKAWKGYIS